MTEIGATNHPPRTVYTVSELNTAVRELLEHSFPLLWVEGEISNLAKPRSGHWYFSLKDGQAQVRCAMFRNKNQLLRIAPADGEQVMVRARISLYPTRGDFQMIVEHMEQAGTGALQRAFEQLKAKLAAQGLFDEDKKRALPALPKRIGVITSATGAALQDVLSVLRRRFPAGRVLLHAVPVQGAAAAPAICNALALAAQRQECDVLLLVRGGGSLEDLWAFNEESVAHAIRNCPIPVVAGVGHEVDTTIADYAADLRAPTPSAAAELVCPDLNVWHNRLKTLQDRLFAQSQHTLITRQQYLTMLSQRLQRLHPERRLQEHSQRLDEIEQRLRRSARWRQQHRNDALQRLCLRLDNAGPRNEIKNRASSLVHLQAQMCGAIRARLERDTARWTIAGRGLHAVSPLNTLERGYAIASDADGQVLTSAANTQAGEYLKLTLRQGQIDCAVTEIHPQSPATIR